MSLPRDQPRTTREEKACAIYRQEGEPLWTVKLWNGRGWELTSLLAAGPAGARALCPRGWRVLESLEPR